MFPVPTAQFHLPKTCRFFQKYLIDFQGYKESSMKAYLIKSIFIQRNFP